MITIPSKELNINLQYFAQITDGDWIKDIGIGDGNLLIFEKVNQTKASIQFNVTPSNIQQILAKSHYYAFKEAFDAVNVIFSEVNHNVRF